MDFVLRLPAMIIGWGLISTCSGQFLTGSISRQEYLLVAVFLLLSLYCLASLGLAHGEHTQGYKAVGCILGLVVLVTSCLIMDIHATIYGVDVTWATVPLGALGPMVFLAVNYLGQRY